jgi:hypothetical protein
MSTETEPGEQEPELPILFLNRPLITSDGSYEVCTITGDVAREMMHRHNILSEYERGGAVEAIVSFWGISDVKFSQVDFKQNVGQPAIAIKPHGRFPDGHVLTIEELEKTGYDLVLISRVSLGLM